MTKIGADDLNRIFFLSYPLREGGRSVQTGDSVLGLCVSPRPPETRTVASASTKTASCNWAVMSLPAAEGPDSVRLETPVSFQNPTQVTGARTASPRTHPELPVGLGGGARRRSVGSHEKGDHDATQQCDHVRGTQSGINFRRVSGFAVKSTR